jgi:hypothetical protein
VAKLLSQSPRVTAWPTFASLRYTIHLFAMPTTCLIGYSGFVGSNLVARFPFTDVYRSTNIDEIRGKQYDLLVCAGASALKWRANQQPEEDLAAIHRLLHNLTEVRASRVVLISTVDVYPVTEDVDESFDCGSMANHAYGRNRLHLELQLSSIFSDLHIVRLPGLFGAGLKKNVIYDLMHDNCLEAINPNGVFQYYDLADLWNDLQIIQKHQLSLVNLVTEPIETATILRTYFPHKKVGSGNGPAVRYDIRSRHAEVFGGRNGYRFGSDEVLSRLGKFIQQSGTGGVA